MNRTDVIACRNQAFVREAVPMELREEFLKILAKKPWLIEWIREAESHGGLDMSRDEMIAFLMTAEYTEELFPSPGILEAHERSVLQESRSPPKRGRRGDPLSNTRFHFDWVAHIMRERELGELGESQGLFEEIVGAFQKVEDPHGADVFYGSGLLASKMVQAGRNAQVFEIDPKLLALFLASDIRSITGQMVSAPYELFYVHLEATPDFVAPRYGSEQLLPVSGIYVEEHEGVWRLCLVSMSPELDDDLTKRPLVSLLWPHQEWIDSGLVFEAFLARRYLGQEALHQEHYQGALRVLVQLMLYLSGGSPDLMTLESKVRKRKRKEAKRLANSPRGDRAELELKTRFTRANVSLVGKAEDRGPVTPRTDQGPQDRLLKSHWVRGHWKGVWMGGAQNRRQEARWIRPYQRGGRPTDSNAPRVYAIGAPPTPEQGEVS